MTSHQSTTNKATADRKIQVTVDMLQHYLYMRKDVRPLDIKELKLQAQNANCRKCHKKYQMSVHTQTVNPDLVNRVSPEKNMAIPKMSRALESFPAEVQLCTSGIPGHVYGVCARRHIPIGTWIGPYAGRKRTVEEVTSHGGDFSFMWEIYCEGRLEYYLDGSDEELSSWMRFIRCARFKGEQNLYSFQYMGTVYYRAFKDISPGTELLVWYDDNYPQYMGIPLEIRELGTSEFSADYNANTMINTGMGNTVINTGTGNTVINTGTGLLMCSPAGSIREPMGSLVAHVPSRQPLKQIYSSPAQKDEYESVHPYKRRRRSSQEATATETRATGTPIVSPHMGGEPENGHESEEGGIPEDDERMSPVEETPSSIFRCGQCGKAFAQKSVLQIHICSRMPHKPYQCGFCGLAFNNPTELRAHAVAHCSEKPFKCGYCSRAFSGATTLNNHIRTHTGEKPFQCDRCGKTFAQGSQLSRHQRISGECSE